MVKDREALEYLANAWNYIEWIDNKYPEIYDEYVKEFEKKVIK